MNGFNSMLVCVLTGLVSFTFANYRHGIHAFVLAASSKHFTARLEPHFQDSKKDEFLLKGTDGETVKAIVDFCYSGCINLTEQNVSKFMAIASSVDIDLLEEKCRRFYSDNLGVTNCIEALMVANSDELRQRALDIVCGNFGLLPASKINKLNGPLLHEILMSNKMHLAEDSVFQRLVEWFQCNEDERSQYMPELLKLIRLERAKPEVSFDFVFT